MNSISATELQGPLRQRPGKEYQGSLYREDSNGKLQVAIISERLVNSFITEVPRPSEESRQLISNIFGEKIKSWTGDNDTIGKSLIQAIYTQCLDDGVAVEQSFIYSDINGRDQKVFEPGHAILNRKAMLTELKSRTGFKFNEEKQEYELNKNFRILPLDLKGFREADLQGAGDYDLNIFTRQLNLAVEKITKELNIDQKDIILGRYGGDEFYVVTIENKSDGKINSFDKDEEIKKIIIETTQSAEGFFGKNEPEKFTIKNADSIDFIDIESMDPVSRIIYLDSLNKDLVIGTEELKGEHKYIEESMGKVNGNRLVSIEDRRDILKFLSHNDNNPYPEDLTEGISEPRTLVNNKIKYLIEGHDELSLPFILAEDLDARDNGNRTEQILDFYQNYLIDPLLNEITMTRTDIFNHIKRGEFSNIYAYEIKMKEINDNMSYVYGDKTIDKFWKKKFKNKDFRALIESGKIKVGRIGGMLVVCETKEKGYLNEKELLLLNDPQTIESDFKGKKVKHEIGFAQIRIPEDIGADPNIFPKVVEEIFNKPTEDWLRKTLNRIVNNEEEYHEFIIALKSKEYKTNKIITEVSARYFDSIKRAAKRIPVALNVLKGLQTKHRERIYQITSLLTLIKDGYS